MAKNLPNDLEHFITHNFPNRTDIGHVMAEMLRRSYHRTCSNAVQYHLDVALRELLSAVELIQDEQKV